MEAEIRSSQHNRPFRELLTAKFILVAVAVSFIGILLLYLGSIERFWIGRDGVQALVNQLGSILVVSVSLALIWELLGKRAFAREIFENSRAMGDIEASGIQSIGTDYVSDPDWGELFRGVRELDIFVAYARTWRNSHLERLRDLAQVKGARIRVILPDPECSETVSTLARRFDMTEGDLRSAIEEARRDFIGLRNPEGAEVQVYYRKGDLVFSLYRFDARAVVTLYSHSQRRGQVPNVVCKSSGTIYSFVVDEFNGVLEQSRNSEK
ncbi:hypothetical protein [Nocardiopsis quinghaiensis]|uniref:hypothetical protein n=1 Tax=Nocardiopsis quinghaiensis TaxID=464995 RepID=UPI001239307D|nr:hypothetical protein [Nocardiopsis quinghaiensis]